LLTFVCILQGAGVDDYYSSSSSVHVTGTTSWQSLIFLLLTCCQIMLWLKHMRLSPGWWGRNHQYITWGIPTGNLYP